MSWWSMFIIAYVILYGIPTLCIWEKEGLFQAILAQLLFLICGWLSLVAFDKFGKLKL